MKEKIKELRVRFDGWIQLSKELKSIPIEKATFENNKTEVIEKFGRKYVDNHIIILIEYGVSPQIQKTTDSIYLAKVWLGKLIMSLGYELTPDEDKHIFTVNKKEFYFKNSDLVKKNWFDSGTSHTQKVTWLRDEVSGDANIVNPYNKEHGSLVKDAYTSLNTEGISLIFNAYRHLSEAVFWLEAELERIKSKS